MAKTLMGAFDTPEMADRALRELEQAGFETEQLSAISSSDRFESRTRDSDTGTDVAQSAASGAVTGGVIGGLAGLLAGVGIVPALAGLFIGGPIAAALGLAGAAAMTASGAVTGVAAGGLIGALMGLGLSQETATSYDSTVKEGGVVLGVECDERNEAEARTIMMRCSGHDISLIDMREETSAQAADMERSETRQMASREPAFGERRDAFANGRVDADEDETIRTDSVDRTRTDSYDEDIPEQAADRRDIRRDV